MKEIARFAWSIATVGMLACPALAADEGSGDVFVNVTNGGGLIYLDGATTGIIAPAVVRAVPPGLHQIRVDEGCKTGVADVTVRVNAIERASVTLEAGTGTVKVTATPPEARITEKGVQLGVGSYGPADMTCGTHVLVGDAEGRQTVTYTLEVPLRGHADVRLDLPVAALGSIAITPTPLDAEVLVDGVSHGNGPMTVDALSEGPHVVSARMDGYLPAEQQVNVLAYQIVRSSIELSPKPPPVTLGKRLGFDKADWPRIGVNAGVTAGALGIGVVAILQYQQAVAGYGEYSQLTYADDPTGFYESEVRGPRTRSYMFAGASGAVAVLSGVLWATTGPKAPPAVSPAAASPPSAPAPGSTPAAPPTIPTPAPRLQVSPMLGGLVLSGSF